MCGYGMADILGVKVNSYTSPSGATYAEIDQYTVIPSTSKYTTKVQMRIHVHTGSATSLASGTLSRCRKFSGSINGYVTGEFWIKDIDTAWVANSDYYTTIEFEIPYTPGVLACTTFRIFKADTGDITSTSTFAWPAGYTVVSEAAVAPGPVQNMRYNNIAGVQTVGSYGTATLSWEAPASTGTGPIVRYDLYYAKYFARISPSDSGWHLIGSFTNTSTPLNPGIYNDVRGFCVSFLVIAVNYYLSSTYPTSYPTVFLATAPTPPTSSTIPASHKLTQALPLTFTGAVDAASFTLWYRINGGAWTLYSAGITDSTLSIPVDYLNNTMLLKAADTIQFKITCFNSYGVESASAHYTQVCTLTAGRMYTRVGGLWKLGRVFVKVAGVWQEANTVYIKVNGTWEDNV